jgi:hypothetical protein
MNTQSIIPSNIAHIEVSTLTTTISLFKQDGTFAIVTPHHEAYQSTWDDVERYWEVSNKEGLCYTYTRK